MLKTLKNQEIDCLITKFHNSIKKHKLYKYDNMFETLKDDLYYSRTFISQSNAYKRRLLVMKEYEQFIKNRFNITDQEVIHETFVEDITTRIFMILQTCEGLKRFCINYIDLEQLKQITRLKLKKQPTYGEIITHFVKLIKDEKINDLFGNETRNLFAHFNWYMFKEGCITTTKGRIEFNELDCKMSNIYKVYNDITVKYRVDLCDNKLTIPEKMEINNFVSEMPKQLK